MRTNEAPGAVSEQIRCITSCCGCEQHQTNEQQKPILPHPPPDEPKVCSVGQVEEALMQFGPALISPHHSQSARSRLELCVLFTSCGPSSVMQRLRGPCGLFLSSGNPDRVQSFSRSSWSTRATHQPHKKSPFASQSADQVRSVGAAWQHGL